MMRRVVLHGHLKDLYPDPIEMAADTIAELISGLTRQIKAFAPKVGEPRHLVRVLGFDTVESLTSPTDQTEIHLIPAFRGGKSGFFQIIIGIIIVAVAIYTGGAGLTLTAGLTISSGSLLMTGAMMILGGLLALLSPAPSVDTSGQGGKDPVASKYLGAPGNTVRIGTRIPLGFGTMLVSGQYLSFNIDAADVTKGAGTPPTPDPHTGPFTHPPSE